MKVTKNMPPFPFLFPFPFFVLQPLSKRIDRLDKHVVEHKYFEYHISGSDFTQVEQDRVSSWCCYHRWPCVSSAPWSTQLTSQRPNTAGSETPLPHLILIGIRCASLVTGSKGRDEARRKKKSVIV